MTLKELFFRLKGARERPPAQPVFTASGTYVRSGVDMVLVEAGGNGGYSSGGGGVSPYAGDASARPKS